MSEKIIERNSTEQFREDYQRYGIAVTFTRVIPDYRDGFKPVQRRILWAMYNHSKAIQHTVKSATIVGDTMGKYHAHGDSAVYDTMKPMTNWFESYIPTIKGQGSFGNFQGAGASASRYTEARLSDFTIDCIIDELKASPKSVDWSPNFDNTLMEPNFLPVKIPLLLINGAFGIGLGKKTEIPSHNTNEVIDATITLMRNPDAEITLIPDHCMPCEIVDTNFKDISRTGYGYYKVRGVTTIEDYHGNTAIVIKGTPNLVFLNSIAEKIDALIEGKKLVQIQRTIDESTEFDMRYVIVLKPGADPEYVRDVIYKNTELEKNERVNFEVLDGLKPLRMSYKSYLLSFIEHRKLTKFRVYSNKLQYIQTRIHEKETFIKVLESGEVDTIIEYIKKQKSTDDTPLIDYLVKKLKITDLQAKFIINADLKKLSKGYLAKYKEEAKELNKEKDHYMAMVISDDLIAEEVIKELEEAKAKYGHRRNCKVVKERAVNEVPKGLMTVILTEKNMIKKVPKGSPLGSFRGDNIKVVIEADNASNLLIFDNMGKVFKLPIDKIPFVDNKSTGTDIRFLIKGITADLLTAFPETLLRLGGDKDNVERSYLMCITRSGLIKKMDDSDFMNIPVSGVYYTKLDPDDYVVSAALCNDSMKFLIISDKKIMPFPASMIPTVKKNAKGNKTFRNGALVDSIKEYIEGLNQYMVVVTTNNHINKIPLSALPDLDKPRKIMTVTKLAKDEKIQNIILCKDKDVIRVTNGSETIDLPVSDIPSGSTISTGSRIFSARGSRILYSTKLIK